ncbi:hypothetical protein JW968_00120 [Candidatus Woesearchaeota archaeon]|nr:hypothetical protein [Candidatus Woesearchaeota archaeon]
MVYQRDFEMRFSRPRTHPYRGARHVNRTLEQIGLSDYPFLSDLNSPKGRLLEIMEARRFFSCDGPDSIRYIMFLLNSYDHGISCNFDGCSEPATAMTARGTRDEGYNVGLEYTYCRDHADMIRTIEDKIIILPLGHAALAYDGIRRMGRALFRNLRDSLNYIAGFEGNATRKKAREFFDDLMTRVGIPFSDMAEARELERMLSREWVLGSKIDYYRRFRNDIVRMTYEDELGEYQDWTARRLADAKPNIVDFLIRKYGTKRVGFDASMSDPGVPF